MLKERFHRYCEGMREMAAREPAWKDKPSRYISDYLRENVNYGYAKAVYDLADYVCAILFEIAESGNREVDPLEIAFAAQRNMKRDCRPDIYRVQAYVFVTRLFAVCLGLADENEVATDDLDENELLSFDPSVSIEKQATPQEKKLEFYRIRLLDVSRNNPLVNFKNSRTSMLTLHSGNIDGTMKALISGKRVRFAEWKLFKPQTVLQCKLCGKYLFRPFIPFDKKTRYAEACPDCDSGNTSGRKSMVTLKEDLVLHDGYVACECGGKIALDEVRKANATCPVCGKPAKLTSYPLIERSLLTSLPSTAVLCALPDDEAQETVKRMTGKAKNMERNFGLHVLYLACGFLNWKDSSGTAYRSPILLLPITLTYDRTSAECYFEASEAKPEFVLNRTLTHMLEGYSAMCSLTMPEYDKSFGAKTYFRMLTNVWKNSSSAAAQITKDWTVTEGLGLGLFHYQKLQLEHDIETNRALYLENPVIRRICGDECPLPDAEPAKEGAKYMVLDADSSQENVIRAAAEGKSFILQGPPGSGKSQTITNMIATAAGSGKSVLFVTEKATARAVITDNLGRLEVDGAHSLNDFVLDFEHLNKRGGAVCRDPFVAEINKALACGRPADRYNSPSPEELAEGRRKIQRYMNQISAVDADGESYEKILQRAAPYAKYRKLNSFTDYDCDNRGIDELIARISRFYSLCGRGKVSFNYRDDPLINCKGDGSGKLERLCERYSVTIKKLKECAEAAKKFFGCELAFERESLTRALTLAEDWAEAPALPVQMAQIQDRDVLHALTVEAALRRGQAEKLCACAGGNYRREIDPAAYAAVDAEELAAQLPLFRPIFSRLGKKYKIYAAKVIGCFKDKPRKIKYSELAVYADKLIKYREYTLMKAEYDGKSEDDYKNFGSSPQTAEEWDEILRVADGIKNFYFRNDAAGYDLDTHRGALLRFTPQAADATRNAARKLAEALAEALDGEAILNREITAFFDGASDGRFCISEAETVAAEKDRLADWYNFRADLKWADESGARGILDELTENGVSEYETAVGMIYGTYYKLAAHEYALKNSLDCVLSFERDEHSRLMENYARLDERALKSGALQLYLRLDELKRAAAFARAGGATGEYPKLRSLAKHSIKETILENWEYIRRIKPCFMMSPLNVSQYIDPSIKFDMVIFDESSQIFIEDALASIVRGKQIIIAGDRNQLPPCDFFRADDITVDGDDRLFDEESESEYSVLNVANAALGDVSISLKWHYRSCDETLIAFSNEHFDYNLITFPSAFKNENYGIEYRRVPYSPDRAYDSGSKGSHANPGEAEAAVNLLWREMNHAERKNYSLGVVAFSNAQAMEIESRWLKFREDPARKPVIEAWENSHKDEPLIFCNLDTMQGDERDTMLLSVCYSKDANGRFTLPYLGRLRLRAGKKRLNVAVTRARRRMIVISTLDVYSLKSAIEAGSAPAENKEGAVALCEFLDYAETIKRVGVYGSRAPATPVAASVCAALDEAGIDYRTEIGRSECKINIGVCAKDNPENFALGIIIDNPSRPDLDSVREYTRLTEQLLENKYFWKIYRVFPEAWIKNYSYEKAKLLDEARRALNP